jgi:hypothetical protein
MNKKGVRVLYKSCLDRQAFCHNNQGDGPWPIALMIVHFLRADGALPTDTPLSFRLRRLNSRSR